MFTGSKARASCLDSQKRAEKRWRGSDNARTVASLATPQADFAPRAFIYWALGSACGIDDRGRWGI